MTRWQFFCSPEMKVIRTNIIICAALGYIIGIGSYVANMALYKEKLVVIDMFLMIILSLLINFLQSRVAAIIACVYAVLNFAAVAILGGGLSALPVLVYAVYALILTFKFQKKWSAKKALLPAANAKKEQIDKE